MFDINNLIGMAKIPEKENEKNEDLESSKNKKSEQNNDTVHIASGYATTQSARISTEQARVKFAKPDKYDRKLYDSGKAKIDTKKKAFSDGCSVKDPYTGKKLVMTKKEAKALYGDKWTEHLAESDHVLALEKIYSENKNNPYLTNDDLKKLGNSDYNIKTTSRKFNNSKRSRDNEEFVNDEAYLKKTGVKVTKEGKKNAIDDKRNAQKAFSKEKVKTVTKNVVTTGHEAGMSAAKNSGISAVTVSGITNVVSVIKGEKTGREAIEEIAKDGGKAALNGYAMGGGLTVVSHTMSASSSKFLQKLSSSNVPGKIITAVSVTGNTLKKWGEGEITTQECLIELGDKGLNLATAGYSMAVGQALIPIPIVGGAIGALVGGMLTSKYYNSLITDLQTKQLEHEERLRIIEECNKAAEQAKLYREELEKYIAGYFEDCRSCFDDAISSMQVAFEIGDADGVIAGANEITRKLGGRVNYDTVEEFKTFLDNNEVDVF